jgi:uncharacterized protein YbjT (DUF2867 family)
MSILVVGSTGKVGSIVVAELSKRGADIRALIRDPSKASFPDRVEVVKGDVLDVEAMRAVLADTSTLFLINPVAKDELAQALVMLGLAVDAGVKGVVYVSMLNANVFLDTPHSAAKYAAELMIEKYNVPATILRPTYFMQNDFMQKDALQSGFYAMPIGRQGVSIVDIRDIAEIAALELIRRESAPDKLPFSTIEIVGPEVFTGESGAAVWTGVLGKRIAYSGDDLAGLEERISSRNERWLAYDQVLMFRGFHRDGMHPASRSIETLEAMLGRPLRTYQSFAEEFARAW